jgi:RNA polymerase sigma-70 factor (ECF subfamily)
MLGSIGLDAVTAFQHATPLTVCETKLQGKTRPALDVDRLTRRMVMGDEEAYREFHRAYFNRLLAYLLVVTSNEQLAREALQATFLRVARHARRFGCEEALWSWLTVLARSSVADERRRSSRYAAILIRFFKETLIRSEVQANESDSRLKELLDVALQSIPFEDRELIERKYFERDSVRLLAQETNSSEKAVESRLVRIRQKLRTIVLAGLKDEQ